MQALSLRQRPLPNQPTPLFSGNYRVLVADDNQTNRDMHTRFVKQFNKSQAEDHFETTTAKDGQDAMEKLVEANDQGKPFDMLITDNDMPRMKGIQLLHAMRGLLPFTVMISSDNIEEEARQAGTNAYFDKPAKKENFQAIFRQFKGLITCPLPASKPLLTDLPATPSQFGPHTTLPGSHNPFERAFELANRHPTPIPEEEQESSKQT